jgi:phosphonate transport system ATP-binding protein
MSEAIRISSLSKTFSRKIALDDVSIRIAEGEIVALIGPSGSGKSTLLRHIAGLEVSDKNSSTEITVDGLLVQKNGSLAKGARKARIKIGLIFQQFNLINRLNVLTNVLIGSLGSIPVWRGTFGIFTKQEKSRALKALDRVGLKEIAFQRASTLSGGQQQRVAIARSLMQQANVILADEPIASLDPKSAKTVMRYLRDINKHDGKSVVVTLHQVDYARKYCKRVIALVDGKIAFDGKAKELTDKVLEKLYGTAMSDDDEDVIVEQQNPAYPTAKLIAGLSG